MREAFWPFPAILSIHVLGMALTAGPGFFIGFRLLGAGSAPLSQLSRFAPVIAVGAVLAILSGVGLFLCYPAKAITNWPFYPKLAAFFALLLLGAVALRRLRRRASDVGVGGYRLVGLFLILGWIFVIGAGRFLAYTYSANDLLWYPRVPVEAAP